MALFVVFLFFAFYLPGHPDTPQWLRISGIVVFCLLLVLQIALKLMTAHNEAGKIIFRKTGISIELPGRKIEIPIGEIEGVSFQFKGYEGENYYQSKSLTSFHSGTGNFIFLHTKRFEAVDEIFIKSQLQVNVFLKLLEEYRTKGISVGDNIYERKAETLVRIVKDIVSPL